MHAMATQEKVSRKRLLAVASSGGHWVQLQRLTPAFEGHEVRYVSTGQDLGSQVEPNRFYHVEDANMWNKFALLKMAIRVAWIVLLYRPEVVVSTGAAVGFFALLFGRLMGAKTIWVDSIANGEELSLAGRKVKPWATHWLTQWPEFARPEGPRFVGAVL
jgi:UDP-N-acetylglucosamine:LPS N-acetylglucosamine transferase